MLLRALLPPLVLSCAALLSGAVLLSSAHEADRAPALVRLASKPLLLRRSGRFQTRAPVLGSPAVAPDGTMLVASMDRLLYAVRPNGELAFKRDLGAASFGGVLRSATGHAYVGTDAGQLLGFDAQGMATLRLQLGAPIETRPLQLPNGDLVVCVGRELLFVTPQGKVRSRFRAWGKFFANPVLGPEGDVFVGSEDGNFYAVYPNGTERYRVYAAAAVHAQAVLGAGGFAYFADDAGRVHAVDKWSDEAWITDLGTPIRGTLGISKDGREVLALTQGPRVRLVGLRTDTGRIVYEHLLALTDDVDEGARAGVLVDSTGAVWVSGPADRLWLFTHLSREPRSAPFGRGATTTPLLSAQGHVVVGDRSGQLIWSAFEVNPSLPP